MAVVSKGIIIFSSEFQELRFRAGRTPVCPNNGTKEAVIIALDKMTSQRREGVPGITLESVHVYFAPMGLQGKVSPNGLEK